MYQTATLHLVTYLSASPSNLSRPGLRPDLRYFSLPPVFFIHSRYTTHVRSTIGLRPEDPKLGIKKKKKVPAVSDGIVFLVYKHCRWPGVE